MLRQNHERDSISLGDDIYAPNGKDISFEKKDKLSDFLNKLMNNYLNTLHNNCKWKIIANNMVLGYIKYSPEENAKYELAIPDDFIINLNIESVYCSNKGQK